ncbi:MAG: response regulator [Thiocapsa sp.]|jgi:two-component system sensor histidine kinase RpfC|nr:ATP-binding protein [Thiocapsa sp.]MCG6898095.1 response regulator [Thiocapsa sp.]MCG6985127.1 response regulator [Thiocapsa sp.]
MGGLMRRFGLPGALGGNPEFQSALVRVTACLLGALYIALAAFTGYYRIDVPDYLVLFALYLASNIGFLASILRRPDWPARVYLGICLDVVAISLAIFITREAISPFYLLYILVFISAGTRFGKSQLVVASTVAVAAYTVVLIALDEWPRHTFEAAFFLALLVLLPLYQFFLVRQVQLARAEAEKANKAKGDFLAFMTHELRTPLTGVIGMTDLLRGTRLDAEQRDYAEAIATSADVLGALIGDILDFSKIDAGQLVLERIPFDPRVPVRDVCNALASRARATRLELICDLSPDVPPSVVGDQLRVRQILFNLIGNAIKFTEQGEILVRVRVQTAVPGLDRQHLLFEVLDTGIGIPEDALAHLFERFRQVDESTTRRFGGTGLGTAIARELTLLMGGTIGVDSKEGQGSRFWIRLPLIGAVSPGDAPKRRLGDMRVLVVERNATYRDLDRAVLEREGARCEAVAETAQVTAPDIRGDGVDLIVIADHPEGLGFQTALAQVTRALAASVPCLFLVYPGRRPDLGSARCAYLGKPYLPEDLVAAAESLLGRAELRSGEPRADPLDPAPRAVREVSTFDRYPVLVAEDNEIAARVITSHLTKMGLAVTRVADGRTALSEALSGAYRVAIVDLRMPGLDGIGFARCYRQQAPDRPLPILALTANASEEVKQRCLAAGMDAFLAKPVRPDALRRALEVAAQGQDRSAASKNPNRQALADQSLAL